MKRYLIAVLAVLAISGCDASQLQPIQAYHAPGISCSDSLSLWKRNLPQPNAGADDNGTLDAYTAYQNLTDLMSVISDDLKRTDSQKAAMDASTISGYTDAMVSSPPPHCADIRDYWQSVILDASAIVINADGINTGDSDATLAAVAAMEAFNVDNSALSDELSSVK